LHRAYRTQLSYIKSKTKTENRFWTSQNRKSGCRQKHPVRCRL